MLLFDTGKKLEKAFPAEQFDALVEALEKREGKAATGEDLRETELRMQVEIEKVRAEIEKVRAEARETEARLAVEIEKVRAETEKVRIETEKVRTELKTDIEKVRAELKTDIERVRGEVQQVKYDLLKWQIAGWVALAGIMARGFGWIGL